jgi:hypothetical protein
MRFQTVFGLEATLEIVFDTGPRRELRSILGKSGLFQQRDDG